MSADTSDPVLMVDQQSPAAEEETRLPNSHSAALVMGFILLCVIAYGVYRVVKFKCGERKLPLTVNIEGGGAKGGDCALEGLEDVIKEREAYLAIYGPKSNAGKNERTDAPAACKNG